MRPNKMISVLIACLALALLSSACGDTAKIEEANKFVDAANKKADEAKTLISAAATKFEAITSDLDDFEEARTAHEAEVKDLIKSYDKILDLQKGIASDYSEASKTNPNEKFKAYYDMSAKDAQKTGEVLAQSKASAQAILDSKDTEAFAGKMLAIKAKLDSLTEESSELRGKLSTLETEVKALNAK